MARSVEIVPCIVKPDKDCSPTCPSYNRALNVLKIQANMLGTNPKRAAIIIRKSYQQLDEKGKTVLSLGQQLILHGGLQNECENNKPQKNSSK